MNKIICIIGLLLMAGQAWGTTYYAKPCASYPCSGTAPHDTPAKAGDIRTVFVYARTNATEAVDLRLTEGTYDLSVPNFTYYLWNVAHDLTIQGHDGTTELTSEQVIVDGAGTNSFLFINNASSDVTLKNHTVQNCVDSATDTQLTALKIGNAASLTFNGVDYSSNVTNGATSNGAALYAATLAGNITSTNSTFNSNTASNGTTIGRGGAWYLDNVDGTITLNNTDFEGNTAFLHGGAIFLNSAVSGSFADDEFCSYTNNAANDGADSSQGGAITFSSAPINTTISGTFTGNSARVSGGAIYNASTGTNLIQYPASFVSNSVDGVGATNHQGGGVIFTDVGVTATVNKVLFQSNTIVSGDNAGGGLKFSDGASGTVKYCTFLSNSSPGGGALDFGGAAVVTSTLTGNVFANNTAIGAVYGYGGAWDALNSHSVNASNNTYYGNRAEAVNGGNAIKLQGGAGQTINLKNENIIHGPYSGDTVDLIYSTATNTLNIQNSNIEGGAASVTNEDSYTANIDADPLFRNPTAGDFRLQMNSPAIRAGTGTLPNGETCSIGAEEVTLGMGPGMMSGYLPFGHEDSVCSIP